jgi:hypothetical protein
VRKLRLTARRRNEVCSCYNRIRFAVKTYRNGILNKYSATDKSRPRPPHAASLIFSIFSALESKSDWQEDFSKKQSFVSHRESGDDLDLGDINLSKEHRNPFKSL